MSLNVKTIYVGDMELTLRLTSKALMNFNLKHGAENGSPMIAVLDATTNYAARIDLLTNALRHPENKNSVKDGDVLLDMMADSGSWDRECINELILDLARESGLLSEVDYLTLKDSVVESGKQMITTLSKLLTGKPIGTADTSDVEDAEENPT